MNLFSLREKEIIHLLSGHGERDLRLELTQDFCIRYKP